jgi:hypothetical protein
MVYKNKEDYKEYQKKWREKNKDYIHNYSITKGRENSKKTYQKHKLIYRKKSRDRYINNKDKEKIRNTKYHEENRDKIRIRKLNYRNKPEVRKRLNIKSKVYRIRNMDKNITRDKTKHSYPLKDKKCEFCSSDAKHHHHFTKPYEFNKFWYVCLECHRLIHKEGQDVFLERQRWK